MTVKPEHIKQLLHPTFTDTESKHYKESVIATGLPASPGIYYSFLFKCI